MAFQAENHSWDASIYNVDPFLSVSDVFTGTVSQLNYSRGTETLDTLIFPVNPPCTFQSEIGFNKNNDICSSEFEKLFSMSFNQDLSTSSANMNQDFESQMFVDASTIDDGLGNTAETLINTNAQEAIAAIANDLQNSMGQYADDMALQAIATAIKHHGYPTMRMRTQPVKTHRFRYRSDGVRYLEKSRHKPMAVELPILTGCLARPDQSFWIECTITTSRNNPYNKTFVHQHEMFYNGDNAQQNGLQSFRIPLIEEEIRRRVKEFRHLSIVKTILKYYTFELIPFDPLITDDHVQQYSCANEDKLTKVQKAKIFDRECHTDEYQIVCQLVIKQKDQWYMTDLFCQTHVITNS